MKLVSIIAGLAMAMVLVAPAAASDSEKRFRPEPYEAAEMTEELGNRLRNGFLESCQRATEMRPWCECIYDGLPDPIRYWPYNGWLIFTGTMEQQRFAGQLKIGIDSADKRLEIYQGARETVKTCASKGGN